MTNYTDPLGLPLINIGNQPNDGTGDTIREAFSKINNSLELINDNVRLRLTGTIILYVDEKFGSNQNSGLTEEDAFSTIEQAVQYIAQLDVTKGVAAIIQLAPGTYTESIDLTFPLYTPVFIQGDINDSSAVNIVLDYSKGYCLKAGTNTALTVTSITFTVKTSTLSNLASDYTCSFIEANNCVNVNVVDCVFNEMSKTVNSAHLRARHGGIIELTQDYEISGGARYHLLAETGAIIYASIKASTISVNSANANFQYLIGSFRSSSVSLGNAIRYLNILSSGLLNKDHTSSVVPPIASSNTTNVFTSAADFSALTVVAPNDNDKSSRVPTTAWVDRYLSNKINNLEALITQITGDVSGLPIIPVGTIFPYAGQSEAPPGGYLYCHGQAVSRSTYSQLFSIIGTTYGVGDGVNTFNLPDFRGRFPRGVNNSASTRDPRLSEVLLGQTGGADTVRISESNLPSHSHNVEVRGHTHPLSESGHVHPIQDKVHSHSIPNSYVTSDGNSSLGLSSSSNVLADTNVTSVDSYSGITSTEPAFSNLSLGLGYEDISILPSGLGHPLQTVSPFVAVTYIIKT